MFYSFFSWNIFKFMDIHTFSGFYSPLGMILVNLEFCEVWKNFQGIFTAKQVSMNIQYQLESVSFSNTRPLY